MKHRALQLAVVFAILFVASFFWPGPYRMEELGRGSGRSVLVRVNRFTGRTEVLTGYRGRGWEESDPGVVIGQGAQVFGGTTVILILCGLSYATGRRDAGRNPPA